MQTDLNHLINPASKKLFHTLINRENFYLRQYSECQNPLALSSDEKKIKELAVVDQTSLVIVAILIKFDDNGLILKTPFLTNCIAFNVLISDISLIKLKPINQLKLKV